MAQIELDEIEADLAYINKWSRAEIGALTLPQLLDKHARAVSRHNMPKPSVLVDPRK